MYNNFKSAKRSMFGTMLLGFVLNFAFWGGLIYLVFWCLNRYGIIEKLLG